MENIRSYASWNFIVINVVKKEQNYYNAQLHTPKDFFLQKLVETIPNRPHMFHQAWSTAKKASKKNQATLVGVKVCQRFLYNRENEVPTARIRFEYRM